MTNAIERFENSLPKCSGNVLANQIDRNTLAASFANNVVLSVCVPEVRRIRLVGKLIWGCCREYFLDTGKSICDDVVFADHVLDIGCKLADKIQTVQLPGCHSTRDLSKGVQQRFVIRKNCDMSCFENIMKFS